MALRHFVNGAWQTLTTTITSEDSTKVNYSATTGSFSSFAVAGGVSSTAGTGFNLYLIVALGAVVMAVGAGLILKAGRRTTA